MSQMPTNPFRPYADDWIATMSDSTWIVTHKDDIERVYTKLWQETCSVVGYERNQLDIAKFAVFWCNALGSAS